MTLLGIRAWRSKLRSPWTWLLLGLVGLGILLRAWQYWYFPVAGETQDEVAWTLLGSSLLQTGTPISWSYFKGYQVMEVVVHQGAEFPLVKPAVDHPPLFALLPGMIQTFTGHFWKEIPSIKLVRFPLVLLGALNLSLFTVWLLKAKLKRVHVVTALLIAATAPSLVFLSRLVVSENLLVTWLLLILILNTQEDDENQTSRGWRRWLWILVHAALPLTKISGIAIGLGSLATAWYRKDKARFWSALDGLGVGVGLLMLYMAHYDFGLFWQVQTQQAQRDTGLLSLFSTWLWEPTLVREVFADIWNQVGLIALLAVAWLLPNLKKDEQCSLMAVLFLFMAQLAFLLLSVGEHTIHGWYRIVFWPLWAYVIGQLVQYAWDKRNAVALAVSWLLMAPQLRLAGMYLLGEQWYDWQGDVNKVWLGLTGLALMTLFLFQRWQARAQRGLWIALGILLVLGQVVTVLLIQHERFWQDALYLLQGIRP